MVKSWKSLGKLNALQIADSLAAKIPEGLRSDKVHRRMLDVLLNVGIPFNRWLGLRLQVFNPDKVVVESPASVLRQNHVGTAHACAQALIGEYPAGLLVAQKFPIDKYRMIISKLEIEYAKPGRGVILGTAVAPASWPELDDGEGWIDMETILTNESDVQIAVCKTKWQVKSWERIEQDKLVRSAGGF